MVLYGAYAIIPPIMLLLTCMTLPKRNKNENSNVYDARIIETNLIIGIAICGIAAITGFKEQLFMTYTTCFAMHLAINTFVRLKYYFDFTEIKSLILAYIKSLFFVFIPGIIVQLIVFRELYGFKLLFFMAAILLVSCVMILIEKKNVKIEEVSIQNGYMHLKIISILTAIMCVVEYLEILV